MSHREFGYLVAALASVGIIWVGSRYLLEPKAVAPSFGLPDVPEPDEPFLLVKGIRDIGSGLVVLTLAGALRGRERDRAVAAVLLALSVIPIGDAAIVLSRHGGLATALGIHGLTAAAMIAAAAALFSATRRAAPLTAPTVITPAPTGPEVVLRSDPS